MPRVSLSRFDRVINTIAPTFGLRRLESKVRLEAATRYFGRGGYEGASNDRPALREYNPMRGGADDALSGDLGNLRDRAQDMARNNGIVTGALSTHEMSVVGPGLIPHPRIDRELLGLTPEQAKEWERQAERIFWAWSCSQGCDVARRNTFAGLTSLAYRSSLESGDVIAIRRFKPRPGDVLALKIQLVEAARVCNPNYQPNTDRLIDGVEIDEDGAPVAYHVADSYPLSRYGSLGPTDWKRVAVYGADSGTVQVLHVLKQNRVGQTRGVPIFAPVVETLKQISRLAESELMASVVNSFFTVLIKRSSVDSDIPILPDQGNSATAQVPTSVDPTSQIRMGSGTVAELGPDEDAVFADPKRPNANFDPFFRSFLAQIGVAVELPHELVIKQFTSSYSASRAALLEAWRAFGTRRSWLVDLFCQPIYEWMLGEAVARGLIAAPGFFDDPIVKAAWCEAQWTGPTMGQLNPTDEMNALQTAIDMRIRSRQEIAVEQYGTDWNRTVEQLAEERAIMTDRGLDSEDLSQRFESPVPAGGAQPAPASKPQNRTPQEKP
jgi:lambda family phage portal protein